MICLQRMGGYEGDFNEDFLCSFSKKLKQDNSEKLDDQGALCNMWLNSITMI